MRFGTATVECSVEIPLGTVCAVSSEVRLLRLVVIVASTTYTYPGGWAVLFPIFLSFLLFFFFSLIRDYSICCNGVRTILSMIVYENETSAIDSIR